jgi:hypothetical protein
MATLQLNYVLLQHTIMQAFQYSINAALGTADSTLIASASANVPLFAA